MMGKMVAVPGVVTERDITVVKAVIAGIVPEIREFVVDQLKPIKERLAVAEKLAADLQNSIPATPPAPPIDAVALVGMVDAAVARAIEALPAVAVPMPPSLAEIVAALPPAEPGKPGEVDMVEVKRLIDEAVAALPPAEPGKPGEVDPVKLVNVVAAEVASQLAKIDPPEKGDPGDVDMVEVRRLILDAVKGLPPPKEGKDGIGLAGAMIDRDGGLVLTLSDGTMKELGRVVGEDGKPGKAGFSLASFDTAFDGERTLTLKFADEREEYEHQIRLTTTIYRGVFKEGCAYELGDLVTWAGSLWHCDAMSSTAKPDAPGGDWTLAVKRGRPGQDKN